jgi:hypothetical protein
MLLIHFTLYLPIGVHIRVLEFSDFDKKQTNMQVNIDATKYVRGAQSKQINICVGIWHTVKISKKLL